MKTYEALANLKFTNRKLSDPDNSIGQFRQRI